MTDEKPMSVKERLAALATASTVSASTPAPPKSTSTSRGSTIAQRLAKLTRGTGRRGGSTSPPNPENPLPECSPPAPANSSTRGRIATINGVSDASSASMSPSSSHSVLKLKPAFSRAISAESAVSSAADEQQHSTLLNSTLNRARAADGKSPAAPGCSRLTSEQMQSFNSDSSNTGDGATGASAPPPSETTSSVESPHVSPKFPGRIQAMDTGGSSSSPKGSRGNVSIGSTRSNGEPRKSSGPSAGLAARIQALNAASVAGSSERLGNEAVPPTPPFCADESPTPSKMSPGLAARMQALEGLSPGISKGNDAGDASEKGAAPPSHQRLVRVGLPGMGMAIPLPGVIPPGGLSELKRRKQMAEETQREEFTGKSIHDDVSSAQKTPEQQPGQLQHASLSRATMPQRRRPRKPARPLKAGAAAGSTAKTPITEQSTTQTRVAITTSPMSISDTTKVVPEAKSTPAPVDPVVQTAEVKPLSAAQRLAAAAGEELSEEDSTDEWD